MEERGRVLPVAPNNKALGRQAETQPHVVHIFILLGSMEPAIVVRRLPQSPRRYLGGACVILSGDAPDRLHACDYHFWQSITIPHRAVVFRPLSPPRCYTQWVDTPPFRKPSQAPSITSTCCAAEGRTRRLAVVFYRVIPVTTFPPAFPS